MPIISTRTFKSLARKGEKPPAGTTLRKQLVGSVEALGERALRFTISTATPDREDDIIDQAGWDLAGFLKNPVVLFSHDQLAYPIGRATDVQVEMGALKATVEFVPADVPEAGPRAEAVYQLCRQGFLFATSVGFRPLDWEIPQGEGARGDDWWPGINYSRQELLEFSVVNIPCNAEALIDPQTVIISPGNDMPPIGNPPPVVLDAATIAAVKAAEAAAERAEAACTKAQEAERQAQAAAKSADLRRRIRDALAA